MSGQLFGRTVKVSVGQRGQTALLVEKLRITFKIEKTLEKTPNNSIIEIYNLSPASRTAFEQKKAAIRVTAGYQAHAKDIFIGDVGAVTTKRTGADIITSVEAQDGLLTYQTKEADLSFAPGATIGTIFDGLISASGLVKGEIIGLDLSDTYLSGLALSGRVHEHLDTVLGKQNLTWSIQDNTIQVMPKGKASTRKAVYLTPETGLIGSPFKRTVVSVDIAKKVDGKDAENGVQLKSLLNPELVPGRIVQVAAKFVRGNFKIQKVIHSGDTHSNTFFSDVEAMAI